MSGNLVFILGNYKSGSTWLLKILSLHPEIRSLSETHIFHHVAAAQNFEDCTHKLFHEVPWSNGGTRQLLAYRLLRLSRPLVQRWRPDFALPSRDRPAGLPDLSWFEQRALQRNLKLMGTKEEYCRYFFQFLAERLQPRKYLLEKSTDATRYAPFIHSVFPQAKLLVIYRDGRDVVTSSRFFTENHLKRNSWSLPSSIMKWRSEIEAQLQYGESHGLFTCAYEDLLANSAVVVQRLFNFLALPQDDHLLTNILQRTSFKSMTGRNAGEEARDRFIRKGVSGDWQNHFTAEDKNTFKELAGDLLIKLGYEKDNNW
ncbi:sulfotransferase [candidate division KSB1 bacterium]|nr:sulfotransferase [candidate division KSB1 bacterium]